MSEYIFGNLKVIIVRGDITELEADAIVNAANSYLKHGGGVALAIVRKGGKVIQEESDRYVQEHGPVPVGSVAVTNAGKLKAKYIIHAVGPVYGDEKGDEKLASAIRSALLKAEELKLMSIALPAISTGVYGYPFEKCAAIMYDVLKEFSAHNVNLKKVTICLFQEEAYNTFKNIFEQKHHKPSL